MLTSEVFMIYALKKNFMRKKLITTIKIKGRVKVSLPLKLPDMK